MPASFLDGSSAFNFIRNLQAVGRDASMLSQMKLHSLPTLLLAVTALACASCSKGPGDDPDPVAGGNPATNEGGNSEGHADQGPELANGSSSNPLADRLRLPDMTGLPSDKELTTDKPKQGSGGIIARPPSE